MGWHTDDADATDLHRLIIRRNKKTAQYETRVQGLVEAMEANMQEKEAK